MTDFNFVSYFHCCYCLRLERHKTPHTLAYFSDSYIAHILKFLSFLTDLMSVNIVHIFGF